MPKIECEAIYQGLLGKDTVGFLQTTVIKTGTSAESGIPTSATRLFDFTNEGKTSQGGTFYDHITSENPKLITGFLEVSYLPWGRDSGYYIILEPEGGPDIMMTAMLSGCSVGYVRSDDGAVRVSHHNIQGARNEPAQRKTLNFAEQAFHPSDYKYGDFKKGEGVIYVSEGYGFVFGVRRHGDWTMYRQKIVDLQKRDSFSGTLLATAISITGAGVF